MGLRTLTIGSQLKIVANYLISILIEPMHLPATASGILRVVVVTVLLFATISCMGSETTRLRQENSRLQAENNDLKAAIIQLEKADLRLKLADAELKRSNDLLKSRADALDQETQKTNRLVRQCLSLVDSKNKP